MTPKARLVIPSALALTGPLLLALAWLRLVGAPSTALLVAAGVLAVVVLVADVVVVLRRKVSVAVCAVGTHAALAFLLLGHRASPLPAPPLLTLELPPAHPPQGMALHALPTGVLHRSAAFGYRGGSPLEPREFAMTAVLVTHPRGDVLIDTGFGEDIEAQLDLMPLSFRALTQVDLGRSARAQLEAAGYDFSRLAAILLTHAHWDHASGLGDFPSSPVWVTPEERGFVENGGWITAVARSAHGVNYVEYAFEDGPFLGFGRSRDVYDDGAIVIVPAPGHTPGSVIVFVTLPKDERYAFIGDLAWQLEGVTEREERPWPMRAADSDPSTVRDGLIHLSAISARFPQMRILPAHDARAFASLPRLD